MNELQEKHATCAAAVERSSLKIGPGNVAPYVTYGMWRTVVQITIT